MDWRSPSHSITKSVSIAVQWLCDSEPAKGKTRQRAGYGRAEIQVLDESGNIAETITNENERPLV